MNSTLTLISALDLAIAFIPVAIVIAIMYLWSAGAATALYATTRMLVQLLLIGYVLVFIFETDDALVVAGVLVLMLSIASWIAIRPVRNKNARTYLHSLLAIGVGGGFTLALVSQAVVGVEPWFSPQYVVPLAGMIFAGAMNAVSLAAERMQSELDKPAEFNAARRVAFQAALIPITNSLLAVGLVALPGMMTGQILSGISPLVAAKYQIVVMTMLFGASGIAAAIFLTMSKNRQN